MHITLSPCGMDSLLEVSKSGDALTINGEAFDFSDLPDGATIASAPSPWMVGPVERIDGRLHLTLRLPHNPNRQPSAAVAFPAPIIDPPDGPIDLPYDSEPEPEEPDHVES